MNIQPHEKQKTPGYPSLGSPLAIPVATLAVISGLSVSCQQQVLGVLPYEPATEIIVTKDSNTTPSSNHSR